MKRMIEYFPKRWWYLHEKSDEKITLSRYAKCIMAKLELSILSGVLLEAETAYSSRAPQFTPDYNSGSVLIIFLVFCIVLLCVLTFWIPCCDVHYDFRIKTMFGSSLPPVVCRRAHIIFTLFVFVCKYIC